MKKNFKSICLAIALSALIATPAFACIGLGCNTAAVSGGQQNEWYSGAQDVSPTYFPESLNASGQSWANTYSGQGGSFSANANAGIKIPFVKQSADVSGFSGGQSTGQSGAFGGNSPFFIPGATNVQGAGAVADAKTDSGAFAGANLQPKTIGILPTTSTEAAASGIANQATGGQSFANSPDGKMNAGIGASETNTATYNAVSKDKDLGCFQSASGSTAGGTAHVEGGTLLTTTYGSVPNVSKFAASSGVTGNSGVATAYGDKKDTNVTGSGSMDQGSYVEGTKNPNNWAGSSAQGSFCYDNSGKSFATGSGATSGSTFSTLSNVPNGVSGFTAAQQSSWAK